VSASPVVFYNPKYYNVFYFLVGANSLGPACCNPEKMFVLLNKQPSLHGDGWVSKENVARAVQIWRGGKPAGEAQLQTHQDSPTCFSVLKYVEVQDFETIM
jgi:hypothetical protein